MLLAIFLIKYLLLFEESKWKQYLWVMFGANLFSSFVNICLIINVWCQLIIILQLYTDYYFCFFFFIWSSSLVVWNSTLKVNKWYDQGSNPGPLHI
jgi:hypothetical protein